MSDILYVHAAATWFMVGLIWFVQVVHYPLFRLADPRAYPPAHMSRTAWIVTPPMLVELATAVLIVRYVPGPLAWMGLALVVTVWASTLFVQAPLHRAMLAGFHRDLHETLVATNWVRTVLWTARGALAAALLP